MVAILNKASLAKDLYLAKYTQPKPIVIHMNITNRCNLKCAYCYSAYYTKQYEPEIPTGEWLKLIDTAHKMGTRRVNLGGGEPLMRTDIKEIVEHLKRKNIVVSMNTNGHLVRHNLHVVKQLDSLCISIDGDETTHDSRKGKGSYQKVLEAIRLAKQNGVDVHSSTLIDKNNISTITSVLEMAKNEGIHAEFLFPFFQGGGVILPSDSDIKAISKMLVECKLGGYPISASKAALDYINYWDLSNSTYSNQYTEEDKKLSFMKSDGKTVPCHIPCYAGRFMCIIDYDGFVYPCSSLVRHNLFKALSFTDVGLKVAFYNTQHHKCRSCYAFTSFNDYNLLIAGHIPTYKNYIKQAVGGVNHG